jgi:penicillin-binding protein 1A
MSAGSGDPVGIIEVRDRGDDGVAGNHDGELVKDNDGNTGQNKVVAKQVIDPAVAAEAKTLLTSVVTSGTGENAQTGEPTWGKTGTTDDNGDAWFVGSTEELTIAVWVGHADSNTPMETEFGGNPVDGGTFPALIFSRIIDAWEGIQDARQAGREVDEPSTTPSTDSAAPVPDASAPAPAPDTGGGGGAPEAGAPETGGGAPAAPTGGGVAAG